MRWPPGSLDLVYCHFLPLHLSGPGRALREMTSLLKPDGVLVYEDGDPTSAGSEPTHGLPVSFANDSAVSPRQ
jgi:SAM-dependent methyltransferase